MLPRIACLALLGITAALPSAAGASDRAAPHPFLLWTQGEAAAIRKRIATEPWAKAEYDRLVTDPSPLGRTFRNLFCYCVMGDRKAGLAERDYLLRIVGKGGTAMRINLEGIPRVGYPRIDIPGGMPRYPKVTMGDAKGDWRDGPRFDFQHALVNGYLTDATNGNPRWMQANMNGRDHRRAKVDKMLEPLWLELQPAHPRQPHHLIRLRRRGPTTSACAATAVSSSIICRPNPSAPSPVGTT